MEPDPSQSTPKPSSLRWQILRRALLRRRSNWEKPSGEISLDKVSRRTRNGFNLIPCHVVNDWRGGSLPNRDACFCYTLPLPSAPKLFLCRRWEDCVDLNDFEVCNRYDIDNTGLVYIQRNIEANTASFGDTEVKSLILHWDQLEFSDISGAFDVIVASDCTFFKEFHKGLAQTIRCLLKEDCPSEAILFCPKRGDSLDKFLLEVKENGLHFTITETYSTDIWRQHINFINGDPSWPNYESDHCYPLLLRITRRG